MYDEGYFRSTTIAGSLIWASGPLLPFLLALNLRAQTCSASS